MANQTKKVPVGLRLTPDALALLRQMAQRSGLNQTGIIELAIREKATREGVQAASTSEAQL